MATSPQVNAPQFSAGVDEPALMRALEPLLASASRGGRWGLIPGGEGIERSFKFKTFAKTWVSQLLDPVPFSSHHSPGNGIGYGICSIRRNRS